MLALITFPFFFAIPCLSLSCDQEEDNSTYNFRWYTSYACPEEPLECVVTDPSTLEQYDLSR